MYIHTYIYIYIRVCTHVYIHEDALFVEIQLPFSQEKKRRRGHQTQERDQSDQV